MNASWLKRDGQQAPVSVGPVAPSNEAMTAFKKRNDAMKASQRQRELVLAAVQQDGMRLEFASDELKADPEIVAAAVKQNPRAATYAKTRGGMHATHATFTDTAIVAER